MASHLAITGILQALKDTLDVRMSRLPGRAHRAVLLGFKELSQQPSGENLGIYLHRIAIDPYARNRYLRPADGQRTPRPELPVNLHLLLVGWSNTTEGEMSALAAGMQVIGGSLTLDASRLALLDSSWDDHEAVQVMPEDMSTEDLMRLWDSLPGDYRLSSPYLVKTIRLAPDVTPVDGPLVRTVVVPTGTGTDSEVAP
ncbi:MAG: hypothetical protein RL375_715 [Pseudomonadota bacterium]